MHCAVKKSRLRVAKDSILQEDKILWPSGYTVYGLSMITAHLQQSTGRRLEQMEDFCCRSSFPFTSSIVGKRSHTNIHGTQSADWEALPDSWNPLYSLLGGCSRVTQKQLKCITTHKLLIGNITKRKENTGTCCDLYCGGTYSNVNCVRRWCVLCKKVVCTV